MQHEKANATDALGASVSFPVGVSEECHAEGIYTATCIGPREELRDAYVKLRDEMLSWEAAGNIIEAARLKALMSPMEETKWTDTIENLVVNVGKNLALDTFLAGSAYTVTGPYMFLVGGTPASAAATDTMATKTGWTEVGLANDPDYTGPRKTCAWSAAGTGSKALSAALSFAMLNAGTVAGCGIVFGSGAVSTIDSTAGVLYSVGAFTAGSKTVGNGDTLNVSYTASL